MIFPSKRRRAKPLVSASSFIQDIQERMEHFARRRIGITRLMTNGMSYISVGNASTFKHLRFTGTPYYSSYNPTSVYEPDGHRTHTYTKYFSNGYNNIPACFMIDYSTAQALAALVYDTSSNDECWAYIRPGSATLGHEDHDGGPDKNYTKTVSVPGSGKYYSSLVLLGSKSVYTYLTNVTTRADDGEYPIQATIGMRYYCPYGYLTFFRKNVTSSGVYDDQGHSYWQALIALNIELKQEEYWYTDAMPDLKRLVFNSKELFVPRNEIYYHFLGTFSTTPANANITASATIDATCGFILGGETNVQATATLSPDGLRHKMGVTTVACDAVISTFPKKIMGGSAAITATGTVIAAVVLKANIAFTGSAVIDAIVADAVALASIPCSAVVSPPSATRIKFANSSGCTSTGVLSISSNPLVTQYIYPDIVCTGIFYPVPKVKRDGDSFYTQDAFCSIQGSLVFNLSKEWFLTKPTEIPATCVLGTTPSKVNAAISNIAVDASIDIGSPIIAVKVSDIACYASIVCESSFIYSVEIDLRGDSTGYIVGKINRGARAEVVCSNSISTSMRMIKGAIVNARGDSLFTVADPDRAGMVMADIRCPCTVAAAMIMAEQAEIAFACDSTISFEDKDIRLAYQAETNITAEAIVFPDGKPWTMLAVDFFANAVMAGFGKIAPRGDSDIQCSARVSAMGMLLTMADVGIIGDCTVYAEGWIPVSDKATATRRYYVPSSSRGYIVPYENRQIKVLQ